MEQQIMRLLRSPLGIGLIAITIFSATRLYRIHNWMTTISETSSAIWRALPVADSAVVTVLVAGHSAECTSTIRGLQPLADLARVPGARAVYMLMSNGNRPNPEWQNLAGDFAVLLDHERLAASLVSQLGYDTTPLVVVMDSGGRVRMAFDYEARSQLARWIHELDNSVRRDSNVATH